MPEPGKSQLVRCLYGTSPDRLAAGNLAEVYWLGELLPRQLPRQLPKQLPKQLQEQLMAVAEQKLRSLTQPVGTFVFVTKCNDGYIAQGFSADGRAIQFCGHGALAAAWVVFNECEPNADHIHFSNALHSWEALRADQPDADISLIYKQPDPTECAVPGFAQACLGAEPIAAAKVGSAADYLILELSSAAEVQHLRPDFPAIVAATQRALIVTARDQNQALPGCVFRYFAPQHGNLEDTATGSAAVQLGPYWSKRLNSAQFTAHQLSKDGGWMQVTCKGAKVELAARVAYG